MKNLIDETARMMIGPALEHMKSAFEDGLSQVPTAALAPYATEDIASDDEIRELFIAAARTLIVRAARLELARRQNGVTSLEVTQPVQNQTDS